MSTEKTPVEKKIPQSSNNHLTQRTIPYLGFVLAIFAVFFSLWTGIRAAHNQHALTTQIDQQIVASQEKQSQNIQLLNELNQKIQNVESLTQELSLNPTLRSLHESLYLTRLAYLNLSLSIHPAQAKQALKLAEETIHHLDDPALNALRGHLLAAIDTLNTSSNQDTTEILLQLDNLTNRVNAFTFTPHVLPHTTPHEQPQTSQSWKQKLKQSLEAIKSLVVIQHQDQTTQPLLDFNHFNFVKQNICLELAKAQWAVMQQNIVIYQEALQQASYWLQAYVPYNAEMTRSIASALTQLKNASVKPNYPDILSIIHEIEQALRNIQTHTTSLNLSAEIPPTASSNSPDASPQTLKAPPQAPLKKALPPTNKSVEI